MIIQLNPSIPVNTPKGNGEAIMVIDYSKEDDLLFVVFLDETGECWTFGNKDIRAIKNVSIGRNNPTKLDVLYKEQGLVVDSDTINRIKRSIPPLKFE